MKDKMTVTLIDSGSSINLISNKIFKKLVEPAKIEKSKKKKGFQQRVKAFKGLTPIQSKFKVFKCRITVEYLVSIMMERFVRWHGVFIQL